MVLEHIFQDKDNWKKDTFNRIKSELLSIKDHRFIQYNQATATHLVCVYGKSQVGKTTLILNMIGLKDDEVKKEVSDVLRGGITRGNSSTSTAIIYSQSDSDQYGVRIETLEGQNLTKEVEYFTPESMGQKIKSIRECVETNKFSNIGILHIFIPKDYFTELDSNQKITILDLPGVESRNIHEKKHVESLMTRYVPMSSVCIITVPANEIQSLESIQLPNNKDWKSLSHKFVVVITKCCSQANIKSFFYSPRDQRKKGFKDYIQETYNTELSNILGIDNKTKRFPLDFGDSFERLCTEELHNEDDRTEVIETRNDILLDLRDFILNNEGNNLISCIKDLRVTVNKIEEDKISKLKENIKQKKGEIEEIRKDIEVLIQKCDEKRNWVEDLKSEIERLEELKIEVEHEMTKAAISFSESLISIIKQEIEEKKLYRIKNDKKYFYDKKSCLKIISNRLTDQLAKNIVQKACSLMEEKGLIIDLYPSDIARSIYSQFVNRYESHLYPLASGIINQLKRLLGNGCKVELASAYVYFQKIKDIIQSEIQSSVISTCKSKICEQLSEKREESKCRNDSIISIENRIKSLKDEINNNNEIIKEEEENLVAVFTQHDSDNHTLNKYLEHARKAYLNQRNEIIKKINSEKSSAERFLYILFLGVIDKDYKTLINASNGE